MVKCEKCMKECEKSNYGKTLCFDCYINWSKKDDKLNIVGTMKE